MTLTFALASPAGLSAASKKKTEKCVACVTAEQRARVQKKLDDLRSDNARLKAENERLKSNPKPLASGTFRAEPRVIETQKPNKKNRLSVLAGIGPDSLTNRRKEGGNSVEVNQGPVIGGQYQRLFGDRVSVGAQATFPTRPKEKKGTYLGTIGVDF